MGQQILTINDGNKLAKDINALAYCECSALTQIGMRNTFETVIRAGLKYKIDKNKKISKCGCL